MVACHYADLDLDLLLTGAILHDIGKVEELAYERSFSYTTPGQLIGHIVIGLQLVDEKIRGIPDFPPKLKLLLDHMILSHHGELEFGSPKVPAFAEALVFHHLDNLDSKVEAMRATIEKDRKPESEFTGWSPALERVLLKKDVFLNPPAPTTKSKPAEPILAVAPSSPAEAKPTDGSHRRPPAPTSAFGEKLKAVLGSPETNKS
jgi:3'-5' exoribonuclease